MHLPHLRPFEKSPIVFLTVCTRDRLPLLANASVHGIVLDIWAQSARLNGWFVGHYVVMPDHVHLFACAGVEARPLEVWIRTWKSITATRINHALGHKGSLWQADYFDRYLRSLEDYTRKWEYIALNPVRKGLVVKIEDWPYRGIIHDLRHHASRG